MQGYMREGVYWTIRQWNGGWWMFEGCRDCSAAMILHELNSYRAIAGGTFRAFIEPVSRGDQSKERGTDEWRGYKRKIFTPRPTGNQTL